MKKTYKMFTRLIAILSILAMSTNSFAAVGGNDGSAFVTKAEFDALVNTFNEQMDNYAASLETKVDGAIANYLTSLDSTQTIALENYIEAAKNANIKNVQFMKWVVPQATKDVDDVSAGMCYYFACGCDPDSNITGTGLYNFMGCNSAAAWAGVYRTNRYTNFTGNVNNYTSSYYYAEFPYSDEDNYTIWTLNTINRKRFHIDLYANQISYRAAQLAKTPSTVGRTISNTLTVDVSSYTQPSSGTKTISGRIYDYNNPNVYAAQTHTWSDTSADDVTNNQCLEYNISGAISGSNSSVNYEFRDYYDTSKLYTLQIQSTREANTTDGNAAGGLMGLRYQGNYVQDSTVNAEANNNVKFMWKFNKPTIYSLNWSDLTSSYWNAILGNALYKYQGIPITKVNKEGLVKIHMTLNNADPGAYVYAIADARFPNRTIPETMIEEGYDHILVRGTVSRSGDEVLDLQIDKQTIFDKDNGDYLYIKIDPAVAGQKVTVTVDSVTQLIES